MEELPKFTGSAREKLVASTNWLKDNFYLASWKGKQFDNYVRRPMHKVFEEASFPVLDPCLEMTIACLHLLRNSGVNANLIIEEHHKAGRRGFHFAIEVPDNQTNHYLEFTSQAKKFVNIYNGSGYEGKDRRGSKRTQKIVKIPFEKIANIKASAIEHITPELLKSHSYDLDEKIAELKQIVEKNKKLVELFADRVGPEWKAPIL